MSAIQPLPRLYLRALLSARRRYDRRTRFDAWTSEPVTIAPDPGAYRAYARVLGLQDPACVLPSWYFVLGQRPVLGALTDSRFPFPAAGIIHVANRTHVERTAMPETCLDVTVQIAHGGCTSAGHRIEVTTRFQQDGLPVAINVMSALVRCAQSHRPRSRSVPEPQLSGTATTVSFSANIGRRYARVSGDYNPIHLHSLSARLFGFRRPIAHGMYSAGRIAALLHAHGHDVQRQLDVTFTRPVVLPATTLLRFETQDTATHFELASTDGDLLLRGSAC